MAHYNTFENYQLAFCAVLKTLKQRGNKV